ncbi:MAG: acyl-CoA dehydrogenase family protein [Gammaproteobacteria bacterium]|nr:acyl-CoA dehydrogenase family protein [Gammaproteobacteria bacterium]MDD9895773.1 acyl-CoA dehydrogenase family protein [Gammaproteobacteria bacterium]MDD9959904.1 acyl-CoA dehydrogenase family protein [Gammaproteobacteria bacterium]
MNMQLQALDDFRISTRKWLEKNCPPSMRTAMVQEEIVWGGRNPHFENPESKLWLERMAVKGWTCPTWPTEFGGGGLTKEEAIILNEELRRINARPALTSFGISMLGPVLLEYGSHEQQMEHLPKIVRGEIRWCQGYSEPGSGSDLASLKTRAELQGEHYLINGSKVWTSYADKADWIFCLVRTDFEVPKHSGISFILFDMSSEGVSTKPIQLISGASPFCETFFDDVKVPASNLVGRLNDGWTIAKRLLQHERTMISSFGLASGQSDRGGTTSTVASLEGAAMHYRGDREKLSDPVLRDEIAQFKIDSAAFALTSQRSVEESKHGQGPNATSSMLKNYGCELNKRRYEILMKALGSQGLGWEGDGFDDDELLVTREWLRSKANSIEGGTSEIQLNVIAKRVLGLPDILSMSKTNDK